ncbi:hypothetical protein HY218_02105 [Candidatus Saccharibacteria bacterium]|nr:hypothetical protein [Candidatus Saccharibacteria bacterium]
MDTLLLHPLTRTDLDHTLAGQTPAILLSGQVGSGKYYTARRLAEQQLNLPANGLIKYPYFLHIAPKKGGIGIDDIRQLTAFLQLKTVGQRSGYRRAVIIEDAHTMTLEAQNALLKSLEEPPNDTVMILTAIPTTSLLGTIYSRVQLVSLKKPSLTAVQAFYNSQPPTAVAKAYQLSNGAPGLLAALLTDDASDHPLNTQLRLAKTVLRQSPYERLIHIDNLLVDKESLRHFLQALKQLATVGLQQAAGQHQRTRLTRWHHILKESYRAETRLLQAANTKLLLTDLLLEL